VSRRVIRGATSLYEGVTWLCAKSGVSVKVPATPTTGTENSLAATATIKCPVLHSAPPSACIATKTHNDDVATERDQVITKAGRGKITREMSIVAQKGMRK
jgi:hypothetical protein